jgi:hypothetical protein
MTQLGEVLADIGSADIIVAIPCYKEVETIVDVMKAAAEGLAESFPNRRSVLIVSDGDSDDGTREAAQGAEIAGGVDKVVVVHPECPGKGAGLRVLFDAARKLSPSACATFDADLKNMEPGWVRLMMEPVLKNGFEYVAPYYRRDKNDATITNNICYPLTRALYGIKIRQPIGGEFAFSGDLARFFAERADAAWNDDIANYGVDIWMTTLAVGRGKKVCQSFLGAKEHNPKDPFRLKGMFSQVVSTLFSSVKENSKDLKPDVEIRDVEMFGSEFPCDPKPVSVSRDRLREDMAAGRDRHSDTWNWVIEPEYLEDLLEIFDAGADSPVWFPLSLWVRLVYDFLTAYCGARDEDEAQQVVEAMAPVYCAKVLSFVEETEDVTNTSAERIVEGQAEEFERRRSSFIDRIA